MKRKTSHKQETILARRSRVIELYSKGLSEREMAKVLDIPRSTIGLDIRVLRRQARTNIKTFVEDRLPFEHESLIIGIKKLLRKAWDILEDEKSSDKAIANATHTILNCYAFKRQLLMDTTDIRDIEEGIAAEAEAEAAAREAEQKLKLGYGGRYGLHGPELDDLLSQAKF